jgi:hypothetical protein
MTALCEIDSAVNNPSAAFAQPSSHSVNDEDVNGFLSLLACAVCVEMVHAHDNRDTVPTYVDTLMSRVSENNVEYHSFATAIAARRLMFNRFGPTSDAARSLPAYRRILHSRLEEVHSGVAASGVEDHLDFLTGSCAAVSSYREIRDLPVQPGSKGWLYAMLQLTLRPDEWRGDKSRSSRLERIRAWSVLDSEFMNYVDN